MVGGLGSASVELILQEGTLAGVRNFLLTGSCASLGGTMAVGSFFLPTLGLLRPGAFSEYNSTKTRTAINTAMQEKLKLVLKAKNIPFHEGLIISTDAFYGIGGGYDLNGKPSYAGAPLRNQILPESLPLALENSLSAQALDMECAGFFALGQLLEGIDVAAMKVVSNSIPWDDNFDSAAIAQSVKKAVQVSLEFLLYK